MERKKTKKVMAMVFAVAMVLSMFTIAVSKVNANDTVGNMSTSESRIITVNLTPPLDDTYVNSANPDDNYGLATYLLAGTETWGSSTIAHRID